MRIKSCGIWVSAAATALFAGACKDDEAGVPRPPGSAPASKAGSGIQANPHAGMNLGGTAARPKAMPDTDISGVEFTGEPLVLTGVAFSVPKGWVRETPKVNSRMPSATAKAQFRLPQADNEAEDAGIVITHFPGMKGMDDANLARWYGQFSQPDGRATAEVATKATYELDGVTVTLVDIPGTMRAGGPMMGAGSEKSGYRMLAAIVDHKDGPHFFKLTGPSSGVERWKASAVAFLKSAKPNQ